MGQSAAPATPEEACNLAGIPIGQAEGKCEALKDNADYYGPCVYDYCASEGDESFVDNAVSTQQAEAQRARLYPRAPASALPTTTTTPAPATTADEDYSAYLSTHV